MKSNRRKLWAVLVSLAMLGLSLANCRSTPQVAQQETPVGVETTAVEKSATNTPQPMPEKPTVTFAQGVDATYLDPHIDTSGPQMIIAYQMFDPLFFFNSKGELVPYLAESVDVPDPQTYVFKLRKGVKFHDGSELTAKDVKFSLERCPFHQDTMIDFLDCDLSASVLDKVNVLDDYTVEVKLKTPYGPFMMLQSRVVIVPEDAVLSMGPEAFNEHPVGTGPFKFVEWVRDERIVMEANEDYWGGAPQIGKLIIRPIPEAATRMAALRAGEVDVIYDVPPDSISTLEQDPNVQVKLGDQDRLIFIYLNTFAPPFDNILVRQAVNYAVDWDAIIKNVLGGVGYRTPCPITPYDFPYDAIKDICEEKAFNYDPDKAKELLAQAGYPSGFELTLEGPDGRYLKDKEVLQAIGGYLDEVGIKTTVKPQEWGVYYKERFYNKLVAAGLFGMNNPIHDIDWLFANHFDPDRRSFYYNTPRLTELSHMGIGTPYSDEREKIYGEAMEIIMDDVPWIFGYGQVQVFGFTNRIDWEPWPGLEVIPFHEVKVKE